MREKLECPDCDSEMFQNQAGGLTCKNKKCRRVIFHTSAETHRQLLTLIKTQDQLIKSNEKIIERQDKIIEILRGGKT